MSLTRGAYPSLFPGLPKYLSDVPSKQRTDPADRFEKLLQREQKKCEESLFKDKVTSLDELFAKVHKNEIILNDWMIHKKGSFLCFFKVSFNDLKNRLNILKSIILDENLKVSISIEDVTVPSRKFESILGSELLCDLYSKLENLLRFVDNYVVEKEIQFTDLLLKIQHQLSNCVEIAAEDQIAVLQCFSEQLDLLKSKKKTYTTEFLLFSCTFSFMFPAAYKYLREQKILILPNPTYLKTFGIKKTEGNIKASLRAYLSKKVELLTAHERKVCLLLDEIYVKPKISYGANEIFGTASNSLNVDYASTVQAFMIKSILSKNKDIAALFPVKNLDASFLLDATMKVLKLLSEVGFEVVAIISDNNKVNVKLFKHLGKGVVTNFITNPFDESKKIFLLYDTVHILKNIRNNWLNEKSKTFIYPSFTDHYNILSSNFRDIVNIYEYEKKVLVKQAPNLTFKVCYPNNLERQNVKLALSVFHEKTIAAIKTDDTKHFLNTIHRWWMIVNVKHPEKGKRLRDTDADPIQTMSQTSIQFLKAFIDWLKDWEDIIILDTPKRTGKLSFETYSALLHTTETLVQLTEYLLNCLNFKYVMLGSFQTDALERRFSQYRKMSGCNYNVSVQQLYESERKLKVLSLLKLSGNDLHIKDIIKEINTTETDQEIIDSDGISLGNFEEILEESCSMQINSNEEETIVFIAGYVGRKVADKCKCSDCSKMLITQHKINFEMPKDYFSHLNRGGLKFPTDFSLKIGINAYKVFSVITSATYEAAFLSITTKKSVLKAILIESLDLEEELNVECCQCGKPTSNIIEKCVDVWINILLNNYTKVKTNLIKQTTIKGGKSRKLTVFKRT